MKILLIDDDPDFLELSKLQWEKREENTKVKATTDPDEALELSEKKDYDVIVADYKMPEMNGLEILENLREKGDKTPFIILTGKGGEDVAMEALNLDADRYIKKNMEPEKQYKEIIDTIFDKPVSS
ncbi:hypothetical protein AKJ51_00445 [candidate division MSBL1 archaeon SCGC-AAA382A20]|uniref:Response regulatory domain-containing protein n=1 Tax=candidate division MSBL1 archaeon SCGC-AAA382A20 TaxID=1698280 RepID=A0A133VMK4_9EURY|nr:hypothetical protein AKJ51_00445 [candidate division MSBL1 archaeon SCGC-AAA382A20]